MNTYQQMKEFADKAGKEFAEAIDIEIGWSVADKIVERITKYSGKGRPRKTDCDIYKHPFSGELRKVK
jgi:hypothetical protein